MLENNDPALVGIVGLTESYKNLAHDSELPLGLEFEAPEKKREPKIWHTKI